MATYKVKTDGNEYQVTVVDNATGGATVTVDGQRFDVEPVGAAAPVPLAVSAMPAAPAAPKPPQPQQQPAAVGSGAVTAPIPGVVTKLCVAEGDTVAAGETLLKLEAMKMENDINSPSAGTVSKIHVNEGAEVKDRQLLVEIQ